MNPPRSIHKTLRSMLLGQSGFPTAVDLPLQAPQTEVAVWLYGFGEPRDVTKRHSVACSMPSFFCISFDKALPESLSGSPSVSLHFTEREGQRRLLGTIHLKYHSTIASSGPELLLLFRAMHSVSTCVPCLLRWIRTLWFAHERWSARRHNRPQIGSLDNRCNEVAFFCPRPVVLVSIFQAGAGNIFPMNLMGRVGEHHFAFALKADRMTAAAVSAYAELAISTVPHEQTALVRSLGVNHHRTSVDFDRLPFAMRPSGPMLIPIPDFALTVSELQVESTLPLGSHIFFVARIVTDRVFTSAPQFHRIHGIYAARRTASKRRTLLRYGKGLLTRLGIPIPRMLLGAPVLMHLDLFRSRQTEPHVLQWIAELLGPGEVCFDVGAHHGWMSMVAARRVGPRGRVVAFEPTPLLVRYLSYAKKVNRLSQLEIVQKAVAANNDLRTPFRVIDRGDSFMNSLVEAQVPEDPQRGSSVLEVETITLDTYSKLSGLIPDLIKVDTEGAELLVCKGAARLLAEHHPPLIVAIHPLWLPQNQTIADLFNLLEGFGYRVIDRRLFEHNGAQFGDYLLAAGRTSFS